jgi:TonB family protein
VAATSAKVNVPQADALPRPKPKEFVPPREAKRAPAPTPAVPDAPRVAATSAKVNVPQADALPRPKPKEFVPPREAKRAPGPSPAVPDAPRVAPTTAKLNLPQAGALPRPKPKEFVPPREAKRASAPAPSVPDAPRVGATSAKVNVPQPDALPRPKPKEFVPPREAKRAPGSVPSVPDAPRVAPTSATLNLPQADALPRPKPKEFVPPREAARPPGAAPSVPDAPSMPATSATLDLPQPDALPRPKPREFTAPQGSKPSPATPAPLPDAPQVAGGQGAGALHQSFIPPAEPPRTANSLPEIEVAPALDPSATPGSLTAAIVGLRPAEQLTELPTAATTAQFSSGPKRLEEGGKGEPVETARIFVPDLMIRDGSIPEPNATLVQKVVRAAAAPTSEANLDEATHSVPILRSEVRLPGLTQVPNAPDPRFSGRIIYMVAIQMPNVTSYIGSWTMWFADREPMPGTVREMRAPVPTHKVDPKYVASAAAERIEGKVRLSAIIRNDGSVDAVTVLQHLDDRLDFTATQALQKWQFQPARRDGRPVDVDAIFEIPFRLEPLATR